MGTQPIQPSQGAELVRGSEPLQVPGAARVDSDCGQMEQESPTLAPLIARLPIELEVAVPIRQFRVRNLLSLDRGNVVETQWGHGEDLPLSAGNVQLAWSEFEVIDTRLAVRVTRVA